MMKPTMSTILGAAAAWLLMCSTISLANGTTTPADTISISLRSAEQQFLARNLQLLAARYSIGAAQAAVTQAGLWSNPNISIEQNVVNQETKRWFDVTSTGNTEIAVQQLLLLAGKRGKQTQVSEISREISELTFYDVLRNLKFQLRSDFYSLYFLRQSLHFYDASIPALAKTVAVTESSYEKGAILLSEVLRLKSLLLSLETARLDVVNQISDIQADLRILMNDAGHQGAYYIPEINPSDLDHATDSLPVSEEIIRRAMDARPDLKIATATVRQEEANLALQRALAVPDLTIGGRWSRAGSYIPDYYAVSVSIDLPIFNRNQGNIAVSENTLEADKAVQKRTQQQIEREITGAYTKLREIDRVYGTFHAKFPDQYATLVEGTLANYRNRNMTVIEFTDFFESYRSSIQQYVQMQSSRMIAIEDLNFKAGTDIIPPTMK